MSGGEGLPRRWESGEARNLADRAYNGDSVARAELDAMLDSADDAEALDALYEWSDVSTWAPLSTPQFDDKKRPLPPEEEWGTPGTGDGQV